MQYFQPEIETMSKAEKRELQSRRLVEIVKYAYENQAPYRAKMDAIGLKPSDIKSIDDIYRETRFTRCVSVRYDGTPQKGFGALARVKRHDGQADGGRLYAKGYRRLGRMRGAFVGNGRRG